MLSDLEVRIEETGAHIEVGDLPTIDADSGQMRQLLQNLIGNALKFHRKDEPPVVKIYGELVNGRQREWREGTGDGDNARIVVADNGIGFDEQYAERIFTIFQRLHSREKYQGTGIGLAVCRKIAERHNGSISAESVPGEGAVFTVTLPVKHAQEEQPS